MQEGPDHYAEHLAAVNRTNAVLSSDDIYNQNGALIVRKGTRISEDVAERILAHRLVKPLT